MASDQTEKIRELYQAATILPTEGRELFLKTQCGEDQTLRRGVEELIASNDRRTAHTMMVPDPKRAANSLPSLSHHIARMPDIIGHYRLLDVVGSGGMGVVYRAEQREPITRIVALKVIKPGFDTMEIISRFESERQTLARMDHPNVAHVFDAGTTETGHPYFVMEYVSGKPITVFADEHQMTIRQRLELFIQVCDAIQHAHTKAIIHRDIKPGNVLAHMRDEVATVKVIDFGIAKAMTPGESLEVTAATSAGSAIGTYEYMSPEQAAGSPDIDTRTDIYSLGVVLYELLVGVKPFERETFATVAEAEIRRIIREVEPVKPSRRFLQLGELGDQIAANRQMSRAKLVRDLQGELEWLPLMAIRKERQRRYESVSQFSEDIQNYFDGKPLRAGPDSVSYRVNKFVNRNKAAIITVCCVFLLLVLGIVGTTIGLIGQARARRDAEVERTIAVEQSKRAKEQEAQAIREKERADQERDLDRKQTYLSAITGGRAFVDKGEVATARRWLDGAPEAERKWEWGYLRALTDTSISSLQLPDHFADNSEISADGTRILTIYPDLKMQVRDVGGPDRTFTLQNHQESVQPRLFDREGNRILARCADQTYRIFDANSGKELVTLEVTGHMGITGGDFDRDGKRVVISLYDNNTAYVCDTTTGKQLAVLAGHDNYVQSAVFSPDGKKIVTGSHDKTARIWDSVSGKQLAVLSGHVGDVLSAIYSPDGKQILTNSNDFTARVWDAGNGKSLFVLLGHKGSVVSAIYSLDGKHIVTASDDATAHVWDATDGHEVAVLSGHQGALTSAAFSPDGTQIITSANDTTARLWDAASGEQLTVLHGHDNEVDGASFSPDGSRLLTVSVKDAMLKVWSADYHSGVVPIRANSEKLGAVGFNSDCTRIVTVSRDGNGRVWDTSTGRMITTLKGAVTWTQTPTFSADGKRILAASSENFSQIWDSNTGQVVAALGKHQRNNFCAAFSLDGTRVVSSSDDHTARVQDAATGQELTVLRGHDDSITAACFSPDGTRIVTASGDMTARVWDAKSGQQIATLHGHQAGLSGAKFSPDGARIATESWDKTVRLWDSHSGASLGVLSGHDGYIELGAFSGDGKMIVTVASDNSAHVWDVNSAREISVLRGHEQEVSSAIFNHDGTRVVTTSVDKTTRVWDSLLGREVALLRGHSDEVYTAAFNGDGSQILTASEDGTLRIWDSVSRAERFKAAGQSLLLPPQK